MKPLVYIAAPYTSPDPVANTHEAIIVATELLDSNLVAPVVPHLTLFWHAITPRAYATWIAYDLEIVRRCDAVLRLPGPSSGADGEVEFAQEQKVPVFYDVPEVLEWARSERV